MSLVADLGGGGGDRTPLQGFDPLPTERVPFELFSDIHFWQTDLKYFLKAHSTPIYANFEGGTRAEKKRDFLVEIFQKVAKRMKKIFKFFLKIRPPREILRSAPE